MIGGDLITENYYRYTPEILEDWKNVRLRTGHFKENIDQFP